MAEQGGKNSHTKDRKAPISGGKPHSTKIKGWISPWVIYATSVFLWKHVEKIQSVF